MSTRQIKHTLKKIIYLPNLFVTTSLVPQAGLGVFADQGILKNAYITIYGGKYLGMKDAKALRSKTHLRTILTQFSCVDADVTQNSFTRQDLIDKHLVGGFINSSHKTDMAVNCKYVVIVCRTKDFPRIDNPDECPSDLQSHSHIMIQATKAIDKGEELIVSYGKAYWILQQQHWQQKQEEEEEKEEEEGRKRRRSSLRKRKATNESTQ